MADRKIKVEILGDAKGLAGATRDAESSLGRFDGALGKLAKGAGAVGVGFGALAVAGQQVHGFGLELQSMDAKAKTVFEGSLASVQNWADKSAGAMGLSERQAIDLATSMADLLKPMGFTAKAAADMATKTTDLSGALSAWSNGQKSAAEVSEILTAAMLGETDGLKALGISISAADIQARLAAKGQAELTGAALQQAEALAVQELILEKSTDAQKAWSDGTFAAVQSQNEMNAKFAEAKESITMALMPALAGIASFVSTTLVPAFGSLVGFVQDNWEVITGAIAGLGIGVATVLVPAFIAWATTAGAAALATLAAAAPVIAVGVAVAALAAGLVYAWQHSETFRTVVTTVFDAVKTAVELWWTVTKAQIDLWIAGFKLAWEAVEGMWRVVSPLFEAVGRVISEMVGLVKNLIAGDWAAAFESFKGVVSAAIDVVIEWFVGLPLRIVGALINLGSDLMGVASDALGFGVGFAGGLAAKVIDITTWFRDLPGKIIGWIGDIGKQFYDLGIKVIQKLIDGIGAMLSSLKNKVGDVLGALNPLNHLPSIDIPGFAGGGNAQGWSIVGEEGPELVHFGSPARVFSNSDSKAMMSSSSSPTFIINLPAGTPVGDGEQLMRSLESYVRLNGLPRFLAAA